MLRKSGGMKSLCTDDISAGLWTMLKQVSRVGRGQRHMRCCFAIGRRAWGGRI